MTPGRVAIPIWSGYLALCLGMFMAILDIQIVASSLPAIQDALGIDTADLSWIQTAYLIAEIIAIPLTGWLTRLLSMRWLFIAAVAGFTAASLGCAASDSFEMLLAFRVIQGFCGGALIPVVFTSVFVLFPERRHVLATTVGGLFAMLAPTVGPVLGGYITEHYSWHWLFLINVLPGLLVVIVTGLCLRSGRPDWGLWRTLDALSLALLATCLASLELLLKEGPAHHWQGGFIWGLLLLCPAAGIALVRRCLSRPEPLIEVRCFADRRFVIGCLYSFVLGMGLFGAVYLTPLYLGFVRHHTAFEIGKIMIVMGAAQLLTAPVAALLEKKVSALWLAIFGYGLFAAGLISNGFMSYQTDYDGLFWPQVLRGAAVMFCLLPATALALQTQPAARLSNASGLFNLMRNLGGAIGIALIDTVLEQRAPVHADDIVAKLQAGDTAVMRAIGLPAHRPDLSTISPQALQDMVRPFVQRAALVDSFNEAWFLLGAAFLLAMPLVWLLRRPRPALPER